MKIVIYKKLQFVAVFFQDIWCAELHTLSQKKHSTMIISFQYRKCNGSKHIQNLSDISEAIHRYADL